MPKLFRDETSVRRIVQSVQELWEGRNHAVRQLTLAAGAASTVYLAQNVGPDSEIFLSPRTANAAAEIGNGTMYISAVSNGTFTITHANNAQTDRTFGYAALG